MAEEWKEVNPDYIVSSDGRVGSRKYGRLRFLRQSPVRGYLQVAICFGGVEKRMPVHRLVAEAFLGPRPTTKHQVNHKNGVKADNRDVNLEWTTSKQNIRHSFDVLGNKAARGEKHGKAKLTEPKVREIRKLYLAGETLRSIAASFGVTHQSVNCILKGKSWAWLE